MAPAAIATGSTLSLERYLGPAFPLGPDPQSSFGPKSSVYVIWTSIVNILTTPKRSVPWNPKLGSIVPYLVFDANDDVTQGLIRHFTFKDLSEQESRIRVRAVNTVQVDDHRVDVTVVFSVVGDPEGRVYNGAANFNLAA